MADEILLVPFNTQKLDKNMQDLCDMYDAGQLDFKIEIQRGYKWKDRKNNNYKSRLILSILLDLSINEMHFNQREVAGGKTIYEGLDGLQRCTTLISFMHGEFALSNLPTIKFGVEMEIVELANKKFDELPQKCQNKIASLKPTIHVYNDLTDRQKIFVFEAINNGMPLTNEEKTKNEIKDRAIIIALTKHPLFNKITSSLDKKGKYIPDASGIIVKQIWGILNCEDVGFTNAILHPLIRDTDITQEQQNQITAILDRLNKCNDILTMQADSETEKVLKSKKMHVVKKMFKKVHISSIAPVVNKSIYDGISEQQLCEWLWHFFNSTDGSSVSEAYNKAALSGSGSPLHVKTRSTEAMKDYDEFIKNPSEPSQTIPDVQESQPNKDTTPIVNESESVPETINDIANEVTPTNDTQSQTAQEETQITFNEDQAKANEQAYKAKRDHHKKK